MNCYLFQGQEKQVGSDYVQFKWRLHDPLTGRFLSVDPLSEKYVHNGTYAFSENKVISHIELEGLESVSAIVMGKVQNTYNGIAKQANRLSNTVGGYSNAISNSFKNYRDEIETGGGITFTASQGEGLGTRRGDGKSGRSVDIDPILPAFGAAGANGAAFKLVGKGIIAKIISALGFMKESASAGDMIGDAVNSTFGDVSIGLGNSTEGREKPKVKFTVEGWNASRDASNTNTRGWTSAGSALNKDSTQGVVDYYKGTEKIKSDTLKPEP